MSTRKVFSMRRTLLVVGLSAGLMACSWCLAAEGDADPGGTQDPVSDPSPARDFPLMVRLTVEGRVLTATLSDSAASRDFVSMLPLQLTLEDYASTEKVSHLPGRLSTKGSPAGYDPSVGDITYYAPWGNLAIFYKDFGFANGLVFLGRIDSGGDVLNRPGTLSVTIALQER